MSNFRNDQHETDGADVLLDQILQDVRDEPVPEFPVPYIPKLSEDARVIQASGNSESRIAEPQRIRIARNAYRALAAVAAVLLVTTILLWSQPSQSAFAKMQAALQDVQSISYTVMDYHANGDSWETKVKIVEPDLSLSEQIKIGEGPVPNGLQISHWSKKLRLHVDHVNQKATFFEVSPDEQHAAKRQQFIEKLRGVSEHATENLGPTIFEGRPAHAFMMMMGDREFKVFVDDETSLPVLMEYAQSGGFREVFQDFVFDGDMDLSLFMLEAPDGYSVKHIALKAPPAGAGLIVVSPKTGIGPVPFGSSVEAVIDYLGEPSNRQDSVGYINLHYNSLGLQIGLGATFDQPGGPPKSECRLTSIKCLGQQRSGPSVHDFAGKTSEGIGINSTMEDVLATYGKPEIVNKDVVNYLRLGMTFYFIDGQVAGLGITKPVPDEFEIKVGEDGSYSISEVNPGNSTWFSLRSI